MMSDAHTHAIEYLASQVPARPPNRPASLHAATVRVVDRRDRLVV
jgi:hypothetical protein